MIQPDSEQACVKNDRHHKTTRNIDINTKHTKNSKINFLNKLTYKIMKLTARVRTYKRACTVNSGHYGNINLMMMRE